MNDDYEKGSKNINHVLVKYYHTDDLENLAMDIEKLTKISARLSIKIEKRLIRLYVLCRTNESRVYKFAYESLEDFYEIY